MKKTKYGMKNKNHKKIKILEDFPEIKDAPDPSNIIWENLEVEA